MKGKKTMRPKGRLTPLSEILSSVVEKLELPEETLQKGEVFSSWDRIAGEAAGHCRPFRFRGTTLVVEVNSPAWMNELAAGKIELLERIAAAAGPDVVKDLRFVLKKGKS